MNVFSYRKNRILKECFSKEINKRSSEKLGLKAHDLMRKVEHDYIDHVKEKTLTEIEMVDFIA